MSRAIIPVAKAFPFTGDMSPSRVTFMVNAGVVHSPQTGAPWFVDSDHNMNHMEIYSLVPHQTTNEYVGHYTIEHSMPRFFGPFKFVDAWVTTNHRVICHGDAEIHYSKTLFHPERAQDKLYFSRDPHERIEIVIPDRFADDREILQILKECGIEHPLQRLS